MRSLEGRCELRSDVGEQHADRSREALHGKQSAESHERKYQSVLDDVLAAFVV